MNRQKSELLGRVPSCPGVSLINRSYDCFSSIDLSGVQSLTSDTLADCKEKEHNLFERKGEENFWHLFSLWIEYLGGASEHVTFRV